MHSLTGGAKFDKNYATYDHSPILTQNLTHKIICFQHSDYPSVNPPPEMISFFILFAGLQLKTHDVLIVSIYLHLIFQMHFL